MSAKSSGSKSSKPGAKRGKVATPTTVWSECGLTVPIGSDPYSYVKINFGFEKLSPSDNMADIEKTELQIYNKCEEIVEKRIRKLARLSRSIQESEGDK